MTDKYKIFIFVEADTAEPKKRRRRLVKQIETLVNEFGARAILTDRNGDSLISSPIPHIINIVVK